MKKNLSDYLADLDRPEGKKQWSPFRRRRGGQVLTREQLRAIKKGRRLLRAEMKERGLKEKEDFELTASSMGLYLDTPRGLLWLRWLFSGRGVWWLVGAAAALLATLFALSAVSQVRGHFTINMSSQMFDEGFILSETPDFENATTTLFCTPAENVPCVSIRHIPENIDQIDGQHNDAYFAYTFYLRNEGESTVDYEWFMQINSESRELTTALWVMVFEDGQMLFYAKPGVDGSVEALPAYGDDSRGYLDLEIMQFARDPSQFEIITQKTGYNYYRVVPISFESDEIVARGSQISVAPGDVHKYTVVIWLEGDDPDCTDDLIGGHAGMDFNFRLTSEDGEQSEDDGPGFWEKLWSGLTFWD